MSKTKPTTKPTTTKAEKPSFVKISTIGNASGSVEIDGVVYEVKGHATLPTFKIEESTPRLLQFDGEMMTKAKTNKDGPILDQDGSPAFVTIVRVVDPLTGEVGQIVCGAVLVRALNDYVGGYIGRAFVLTKHPGAAGKAKQWTVIEVALKK